MEEYNGGPAEGEKMQREEEARLEMEDQLRKLQKHREIEIEEAEFLETLIKEQWVRFWKAEDLRREISWDLSDEEYRIFSIIPARRASFSYLSIIA